MTKKQLIETCCQLRPSAKAWRSAVERHVNYFAGHAGFDFKNWEKGKYLEARGIVAGILHKMVLYNLNGHSSKEVRKKQRKLYNMMNAII